MRNKYGPDRGARRELGHRSADQPDRGRSQSRSDRGGQEPGARLTDGRRPEHPRAAPEIQDDPKPAKGAREIVRTTPYREVGRVNAPWLLSHGVDHESHIERRFIHVALACPVVVEIIHQPETVELTLADGTLRSYTPDFRVNLADGTAVICEVKPAKFIRQHEDVHQAADALFRKRGQHFAVVTDRQIDHNSRSARAILLMRYGRLVFTPEQAQECKRLLQEEMGGSAHVQALVERGVSEALIWHMVASHALRTRTPLNLTPKEPVEINSHEENCLDHFLSWFSTSDR